MLGGVCIGNYRMATEEDTVTWKKKSQICKHENTYDMYWREVYNYSVLDTEGRYSVLCVGYSKNYIEFKCV